MSGVHKPRRPGRTPVDLFNKQRLLPAAATFFASIPAVYLLLSLLIAVAAAWPAIAEPGLLNTRGGGDSPFLLQRLHQLTAALLDGHFPVRWMPDANYGYGYPFYNYYAPLSIYIAAFFRLIGFAFVRAIQLAQLAGFLAAGYAMFVLGRRWLGTPQAGFLASAAYTLAPFHLVNVYVRGDSLAEFWAMAFYPLALLAADNICRQAQVTAWPLAPRPLVGAAVALGLVFAALILSHNISALIFTPFLLLYLGLGLLPGKGQSPWPRVIRYFGAVSAGLALGGALAAWFWLPALGEQKLAQLDPVTEGYFHYSVHFRSPGIGAPAAEPSTPPLVQSSLLFDYDVSDGRPFSMGLVQAGLALAGLLWLLWRLRDNWRPYLFVGLTLLIATFMITPWSRPLWDQLPYLSFTQFPWRFLSVQALVAALASGLLANVSRRAWPSVGLVILLLFSGLGDLATDHLYLTDEDVTAERLAEYEWFTGNIGSTVSAEYLPHTVRPRPYSSSWLVHGERDDAQFLQGEGEATLLSRRATRQTWRITVTSSTALVSVPTLAWPGWGAELDGQAWSVTPAPGSGLISVELPNGVHDLALTLRRTPLRLTAELISLTALLLTLSLLAAPRFGLAAPVGKWLSPGRLTIATALLLLLLLAARWSSPPQFAPGSLSWDFAQLGYLHHAPEGILFSNGRRLLNYSYSQPTVAAGDALDVTMLWANGRGPVRLELVSPAVNRFAQAPILAAAEGQLEGEVLLLRLYLPEQLPPDLYLIRLSLPAATAVTSSSQSRGDLFLQPVRVTAGAATSEPAERLTVRAGGAQLRPTLLTAPAAGCWPGAPGQAILDIALEWFTPAPLNHNYSVSTRLLGDRGQVLAQCDSQPGYGFQPSSSWRAGHWQPDWLALPLPDLITDRADLTLTVQLYEVGQEQPVLLRRLGELHYREEGWLFTPHEARFTPPAGLTTAAVTFAGNIRLHSYGVEQSETELQLTLIWEALAGNLPDWTRFVHLLPLAGGEPLTQDDSRPRYNSHPTSQWLAGEIAVDPLWLTLTAVPPGQYRLAVGLYDAATGERATAISKDGQPLPDSFWLLPEIVEIKSEK
jgi:hypothetical protein